MTRIMKVEIQAAVLERIHQHGERAYPEEGAGFLLGRADVNGRTVTDILGMENAREAGARHNRYLMTPQDVLHGEQEAARRGLDVIGIFHSHPDHPNRPSEFDREWAMPWYSYLITRVEKGQAMASRSWRLRDDREHFDEEQLVVLQGKPQDQP